MVPTTLRAAALAALACSAFPAAALAGAVADDTLSAPASAARSCHAGIAAGKAGVVTRTVKLPRTGLVDARLRGGQGDWDLAVFDARNGHLVAASAGAASTEVAQGFWLAGREVLVQACRVDGGAGRARLDVDAYDIGTAGAGDRLQLVEVRDLDAAGKRRLEGLGLDLSEHATATTRQVVAQRAGDLAKLRAAGLTFDVVQDDLVALARKNRRLDAQNTKAMPSGRTDYRRLADYEREMKQLAQANPGLARLVELPNKSLEGRTIYGLEIAKDVNVRDGRPTFVQTGVHHAREWPSGEHAMEWAYELLNGFGKDPRITQVVERSRTVVVPIVNPDGFNLTREAPVDAGNALAAIDLPPQVDNPDVLPVTDPTYTSALLLDQTAGAFAYKRRNCRITDGQRPAEGECGDPANRTLGTDPNRNYGALWGGPGADLDPTSDLYRGAGPFSEPESDNIRKLVSARQVTTLITNHTFSNLILRPPGVRAQGAPVDEKPLKALADAMAAENGYQSIPGYGLYDTTGTTEDWSYAATGGYGYTFEIGPDEFHPPYAETVAEYEGAGALAGKGNRSAYLKAAESTFDAAQHSTLKGKAPKGTTLRLTKAFQTATSPVVEDETGKTGPVRFFDDRLESVLEVGDSGAFTWSVNPSTRPDSQETKRSSGVAPAPAKTEDISSPTPVLPGQPRLIEITPQPGATRQLRASVAGVLPADDYDIYLYEGPKEPANQIASSASADATEAITFDDLDPAKTYTLEIRNFLAAGPYDGKIEQFGEQPGTVVETPPTTEAYTLTCERGGKVQRTAKVEVARGAVKDLGSVCADAAATGRSKLALSAAFDKRRLSRALRSGLRVRVRCRGTACKTLTTRLVIDGKTARRVGLSRSSRQTVVARGATLRGLSGRRTFTVRFSSRARRALRSQRAVTLTLLAVATDDANRKVSRSVRVRLR